MQSYNINPFLTFEESMKKQEEQRREQPYEYVKMHTFSEFIIYVNELEKIIIDLQKKVKKLEKRNKK